MTALANLVVGAVLVGVLSFAAWCVRLYMTSEAPRPGDWTATVIYRTGQAVIWACAFLLAGGLFAASVRAVWRVVGE